MGMATYIEGSDVEINDMEGLKEYLQKCKEAKTNYFKAVGTNIEGVKIEGNMLDFNGMNDWKIISYWYDNFVAFLRDIAVFVSGEVMMDFESHNEGGRIEFHDGQLTIHTGRMKWDTCTADEMIVMGCGVDSRAKEKEFKQPVYLQRRLAARKI